MSNRQQYRKYSSILEAYLIGIAFLLVRHLFKTIKEKDTVIAFTGLEGDL